MNTTIIYFTVITYVYHFNNIVFGKRSKVGYFVIILYSFKPAIMRAAAAATTYTLPV